MKLFRKTSNGSLLSILSCLAFGFLIVSCEEGTQQTTISSPEDVNRIEFTLTETGQASYQVLHNDEIVIQPSMMSFDFKDQASLKDGLQITRTSSSTKNETWEMPWGEQREVYNHYNELLVALEETAAPNRKINIYFRAYDDGVAFRYEFLDQTGIEEITIMDENTEFQLTGDHTAWWIPGDWDIYE
ncbi:MAG: glycoside hydrolase family 97 N-terminal domain-containing protein, partial [Bacteroidota bacterium]